MPTWTDVVLSAAGHRGERPAVTDAATGDVLSYAALAGLVQLAPTRPQGGGRRRADDRMILAAIVYVATT
ncbi:hypothetical protein ACWDR9_29035, partial [Streptosporangium sandarakinum]